MSTPANIINHIGLVLDKSGSMQVHAKQLITVADNQIQHLARRSKELDQETRISVWTFSFNHDINCVVWDKDVLRLPSIRDFYRPDGQTAFIDATLKSIDDLSETPQRYGDHSFLLYVLTDGQENNSRQRPQVLQERLKQVAGIGNWTVAALVPDTNAKFEAKRFGFSEGNIEIWNTTSQAGVSEVGERIKTATDAFMVGRSTGLRSTLSLFDSSAATVNQTTIKQAGLTPLRRGSYLLVPVPKETVIRDFTEECGQKYQLGRGYYELSKRESIQPQKEVAIVERAPTAQVYMGQAARQMLGLPDQEIRVSPDFNRDYAIFIQSTSVNRKLMPGTRYLYITA